VLSAMGADQSEERLRQDKLKQSEIRVLGLTVEEISRLKSWFENKSGKNITEFWEEAFNAGVKTATVINQPEPVSSAPYDKIGDIIAEFGDNPAECLSIIGELIGLARHYKLYPKASRYDE
jgi:hypothetical protein